MLFMEWTENFSVKVPSIDEQHKKFIGLINDFYSGFNEKSIKERMTELIRGLKDYAVYHFSTEEKYMEMYNFPGYKSHKSEHEIFIEKISGISERYESCRLVVSLEITNFIKDWLTNHILGTDKKYSQLFIEKGVK